MKKYITNILPACLIIGFTFFITEAALAQANPNNNKASTTDSVTTMADGTSAYVTGITSGRAKALVGGLLGLVSLVIGWRAKVRSTAGTSRRTGAMAAVVVGLIGIVFSVVHLSTSAGAVFGSGSGKAGAIVGMVLSVTGVTLGGLTLSRKKRLRNI